MALIKCPECGKEISDQAEFCPHCGYPIKKKNDHAPLSNEQKIENANKQFNATTINKILKKRG